MNTLRISLAAALLVAAAPAVLPVADAGHGDGSCTRSAPDYWTCSFACHRGDRIHATASGPGHPRVTASCGGATVTCQNNCPQASSGRAAADAIGTCHSETIDTAGTCWAEGAAEGDLVDVGHELAPVVVPGTGPVNVLVLSEQPRRCVADLACAGPTEDVRVEHGGVGPTTLAPDLGAGLRADGATVDPTPGEETVGPVTTPGPVPVTVCPSGCAVPAPGVDVDGEPGAYAWAHVLGVPVDVAVPGDVLP